MIRICLYLLIAATLVSCDRTPASGGTIGRFIVVQSAESPANGRAAIIRVDSATGATWRLSDDGHRWVGVEDDLTPRRTYNPETTKFESGIKLPDGRDLSDLSKEELVRQLASTANKNCADKPPITRDEIEAVLGKEKK